jgi:hypothetical protein
MMHAPFPVLEPDLQISFLLKLRRMRDELLQQALLETIERCDLPRLDQELAQFAGGERLSKLAAQGLRGELAFPTPYLLEMNPHLLGYYRLLLGFSKKHFYDQGPFRQFKVMEEAGHLPRFPERISALCRSMIESAWILVNATDPVTKSELHELTLLTLGAQFRGSANNQIGTNATKLVFEILRDIVDTAVIEESVRRIVLKNAAGREVVIQFSADPDITIQERLASGRYRPLVAIEVKGGSDASNIYNRLGEAEKSHQKARGDGYFEFWTMVRVEIDADVAQINSPTTTRFFLIDRIRKPDLPEHQEFRDHVAAVTGIRDI